MTSKVSQWTPEKNCFPPSGRLHLAGDLHRINKLRFSFFKKTVKYFIRFIRLFGYVTVAYLTEEDTLIYLHAYLH